MARFHMTENGILGEGELMTLGAVVNMADPAAAVDLVPGDGLGLGHALVIAD